jgi:acyl-CoA hydrolase/GNAT superfamily N-acetyltransferase
MPVTAHWADRYIENRRTAAEAIARIRPGQRVFIGSSCGEPQHLVRALSQASASLKDIEVTRLFHLESSPLTLIAERSGDQALNIRSFYSGSARTTEIARNQRFITPINLSAVPRLFKSRLLPVHVALIQVSPPDDFGWMSLGVSVDVTLAAAESADLVIAQVNPRMPRVLGRSFIHVNDVDVFVEHEEALIAVAEAPEFEAAKGIARMIATRLVEDGSTIAIGLGATSEAVLLALSDKNDLGVHTQYLAADTLRLFARGVITNRKKGFHDGKIVASSAIGNEAFYDLLNDNPAIEFHPSDYVNDPSIIARHNRMVAMSVAMTVDLTGQVAADALPYNQFSGATGVLDFIRGASMSPGGKSILMLPSTGAQGRKSRIVPFLTDTAVVVPRSDVQHVVTEYGAVNLFGKSLQERALGLISIAHPDFRDELFFQAKKMGLLGSERTLHDSLHGVYPVHLEEVVEIDGEPVAIRPAKPVDERRIQEHLYSLDKDDVIARFFHNKVRFEKTEMEEVSQVDYIHDLTLIAVVGEFGFGQVVAVGEYLLDDDSNYAEIAFSISRRFQRRGLGRKLLHKLESAAREHGIGGFYAYTSAQNQGMIRLFTQLPYKVTTTFEGEMVTLRCNFSEPKM